MRRIAADLAAAEGARSQADEAEERARAADDAARAEAQAVAAKAKARAAQDAEKRLAKVDAEIAGAPLPRKSRSPRPALPRWPILSSGC